MIEREIRKNIIKYAEDINLIWTADECEECISPTILSERDRRTNFINGLESIDGILQSPELVTALILSFVDFVDTEGGFDDFDRFYKSIYYDINKLITRR